MSVERPDYVNLEYEVVVWCDYMEGKQDCRTNRVFPKSFIW